MPGFYFDNLKYEQYLKIYMAKFEETEINSLSEFIKLIERRGRPDGKRMILYRGQNVDKALIPGIARHLYRKSREVNEIRMFNEFKRSSLPHLQSNPKNDLEWLTIAQHYGIPTRLLDWTDNPLAALYFAVSKESMEESNAVVWVFSASMDNKIFTEDQNFDVFKEKELKIFKPSTIIDRVGSQSGWFSYHPYHSQGYYQRIDQEYSDKDIRLHKILIKKEKSDNIKHTLEACGINKYSIFRDLDSLGQYIFLKNKS